MYLNYLTIADNSFEAVASLVAGVQAGSAALIAFAFDSLIELSASLAAQWHLRVDGKSMHHEQVELITYDSLDSLWRHEAPQSQRPWHPRARGVRGGNAVARPGHAMDAGVDDCCP